MWNFLNSTQIKTFPYIYLSPHLEQMGMNKNKILPATRNEKDKWHKLIYFNIYFPAVEKKNHLKLHTFHSYFSHIAVINFHNFQ